MTPRESPRAQSAERAPRAPLSAREAREGPRSTPRLPSPNSRGRARKLRASLGTPNITTHVMGYTGHVPGNQDSMGTNLRSWIYRNSAGKPRPRPYSAGVQQPILGYTGHVPGIIHHSKFNSFHDSAQSCWDEAAPLIRTPRPEELYAEPYCVPPKSQRGWIPFLSTNRADYVDHWKSEHVYTLHCPERPFVEDDRADDIPSHIHGYKIIKDPKEVCTVLDSKTLYAEKWLSEDDPAGGRKTVDLFAALRAKARARIPSGGEIRKSFYYFTGYRSNTISFPAWCKALQLLGLGPIMRKSVRSLD